MARFQVNRDLKHISVINALPRACVDLFLAALCVQETLTELDLRSNQLGDDGAELLARCLSSRQSNESLLQLNISDNKIGDAGFSAIVQVVFHEIKPCANLKHLHAANNVFSDASVTFFAQALARNPRNSLVLIDLHHNFFGDDATFQLADALQFCRYLTCLNVGNNRIGDAGVTKLVQAFSVETSLVSNVTLAHNAFKSSGMVSISRALELPKSKLVALDLCGIAMGVEEFYHFFECLRNNNSLTQLSIAVKDARSLRLHEKSAESIAAALADNVVLSQLSISVPCLNKSLVSPIVSAWLINAGLSRLRLCLGDSQFEFNETTFPQLQDRLAFRQLLKQKTMPLLSQGMSVCIAFPSDCHAILTNQRIVKSCVLWVLQMASNAPNFWWISLNWGLVTHGKPTKPVMKLRFVSDSMQCRSFKIKVNCLGRTHVLWIISN